MTIQISPNLEGRVELAEQVRHANRIIEPMLRQHSRTASGLWDLWRDRDDREHLSLEISDPWGSASAEFEPTELEGNGNLRDRVHALIGEMLNPSRPPSRRERIEVRDAFVTTDDLERFRLRLGDLPGLTGAGLQLHNRVRFLPNRPEGFLLTDFAVDVNPDRADEVRRLIVDCGFRLRDRPPLLEQPDIRAAVKRLVDSHRGDTQAIPRFAVCFRTRDRQDIHLLEVADDLEELGGDSFNGVGFDAAGSVPGARSIVMYLTHPNDLRESFRRQPEHVFFRDLRAGECDFIFPDDGGEQFRSEFPEF